MSVFVPETPYFLVSRNRPRDEVAKNLEKLRCTKDIRKEMKQIESVVQGKMTDGQQQKTTYISLFEDRKCRKVLFINTCMMIFHLLAGVTVIHAFLGPIVDLVGSNHGSGNTWAILVASIKLVSSFAAAVVVDRFGRKPLMIWVFSLLRNLSFFSGTLLPVTGNGLQLRGSTSSDTITCDLDLLHGIFFRLGPVPFAYVSELFPQHVKNVGVPICMGIATIFNTAIALTFPFFMEYLGMQWCFWIYGLSCAGSAIFTKCVAPETKGKTLEEIQSMLDS
ncbi:unnamed protein product [Acanthoscelides obtectus]|uniref:Major facilitator superfamily (MFS) profile domain-containing protein n=1 Tax=Acanthoscelides obtectus TaxID=200917 RepID=A0A9P0VPT6_ACAOB|nr:unnamed protein product [Acanthoscelides obtectus]CAK1688712.1 Probable metabolite transport protein CsbC [Acanthoscelides obtectus]